MNEILRDVPDIFFLAAKRLRSTDLKESNPL
jgi:hypothetical protein